MKLIKTITDMCMVYIFIMVMSLLIMNVNGLRQNKKEIKSLINYKGRNMSKYEVTIVLKFDRFPTGEDIDDAIKDLSENRGVVAKIQEVKNDEKK